MILIGPVVLVLLIAGIAYAVSRARASARVDQSPGGRDVTEAPGAPRDAGAPAGRRRRPPRATGTPGRRTDLARDLARWVGAGLLSDEQAAAILDHERAAAMPAPAAPGALTPPPDHRRIPVVAEALGYLGGVLAIVGLVLVVVRYWPNMTSAGRLALSGVAALALLAGGTAVREQADPALARLRWSLWLASTAAAALFAGVLSADVLGADRTTVVVACSAVAAAESGLLWQWRERPVQQLASLGGLAVFAGALVAEVGTVGVVGLTVWVVGLAYVLFGLRRRTPLPLLTEGAGDIAVIVGALIVASGWHAFGLVLAVATAFGLLALGTVGRLAPDRPDQLMAGIVGGVALLQTAPSALQYFSQDAGAATGLVTWVIGAALLALGARGVVRLALVAEVLGALALIGGAALTGAQWHGFAPIFGIVTAIALIVLGLLPGQVVMSVFGSVALLIYVPWTIAWYFPGEGRAPLLILVSGALILVLAVLLTRMRGRFRQDLGRHQHV